MENRRPDPFSVFFLDVTADDLLGIETKAPPKKRGPQSQLALNPSYELPQKNSFGLASYAANVNFTAAVGLTLAANDQLFKLANTRTLAIGAATVRLNGEASPWPDAPWISAPVYIQEPLGSDLFLTLDIGEARVKVRASPDLTVHAGDRVEVTFDPDKLHLFDGETGMTLVSA